MMQRVEELRKKSKSNKITCFMKMLEEEELYHNAIGTKTDSNRDDTGKINEVQNKFMGLASPPQRKPQ